MMFRRVRKRLRSVLHRGRVERELELELQFHLDMLAAQNVRAGMSESAARRAALQAFGRLPAVKDGVRDAWLGRTVESVIQDVRYGVRTLAAAPAFAAAIVVTIALAVGINTAVFGVAYSILLRPLPFDAPQNLVVLHHGTNTPDRLAFSVRELDDYRRTAGLDALAELHTMWFILLPSPGNGPDRPPERVSTGVVSANYFPMLGIGAQFGRLLTPADDRPGAPAALLLTHEYWQRAFHGDPLIVGRVFEMNDRPHTVVGVLAPFPQYAEAVDVYMPTSACPFRSRPAMSRDRAARMVRAIGRAADGVSPATLQENLARVASRLEQQEPGAYADAGGPYVAAATSLGDEMRQELRPTLLLLIASAGLVLLIGCVSVSNLTLTRLTRRGPEVALRAALGATRGRIACQLLAENASAVAAGAILGLLLADVALRALTVYVQRATNLPVDRGLSLGAVACAIAVSLVLLSVSAAAPLFVTRTSAARTPARLNTGRVRNGLVAGEVALSFVLMIAAALAVRGLLHLQGIDAGFTTANVQTMRLDLNFSKYLEPRSTVAFWQELEQRLSRISGVVRAGGTGVLPLDRQRLASSLYTVEGRSAPPANAAPQALAPRANLRVASPGYFEALGQRVLEGRTFGAADSRDGPLLVVINDALARRWWAGSSAVGQSLRIDDMPAATVVGVVEAARQRLDEPPGEEIYFPMFQGSQLSTRWLIRSTLPPSEIEARVRAIVSAMDPQQPVDDFRTLESFRDDSLLPSRVTAVVVSLFSVLALVITAAGIGGVIGYAAQQRRHEFGVRLALGAPRARVIAMVLRQGLVLVAAGLIAGAVASLPLFPLVRTLITGAAPFDPATFAVVIGILVAVAAASCLIPAVRAARIDPLAVLRSE
jgi:putative ABC transport system permease protein